MSRPHLGKPCAGCGGPFKGSGKHGMCLSCSVKKARADKGESRTYSAIHQANREAFGKPDSCENVACAKRAKRFEWAKRHGAKYTRDRKDYYQLCAMCHRLYDRRQIEVIDRNALALLWLALKEKNLL